MSLSSRDEMRKHAIIHLQKIVHSIKDSFERADHGHLSEKHLLALSITVSRLPFNVDEEIESEPRHITPYPKNKFEEIYAQCFGGDRDTLIEWTESVGNSLGSYPMPTAAFGKYTWPVYEDLLARRIVLGQAATPNSVIAQEYITAITLLLETEVQDKPEHLQVEATKPMLENFTNWRGWLRVFKDSDYVYRGGCKHSRYMWSLGNVYGWGDQRPGSPIAPTLPHYVIFVADDEVLSRGVLASESLCISQVMSDVMLSKYWDDHRIFPVFCYAFSAGHVRITHGIFADNELQLRQTDPIDIGGGISSRDNVKMLLRWILGTPSSDTRWVVPDDRQEEQTSLQDPKILFEN